MVLCHTDVSGALLEVKGRLNQVSLVLDTQLSSAGGDWHCEGVDDEPLALPQVDLYMTHSLFRHVILTHADCINTHNTASHMLVIDGPSKAGARDMMDSRMWSWTAGTRRERCACTTTLPGRLKMLEWCFHCHY